jgi:hypothetical protein
LSNLVEHARRELRLCGQYDEDPAYAESIIKAVEGFVSFGHSGGSAGVAIHQLHALLQYQPLSPLTDDPAEWIDQSGPSGYPLWQNIRDPRAMSADGGKTYTLVDDVGDRIYHSVPVSQTPRRGATLGDVDTSHEREI